MLYTLDYISPEGFRVDGRKVDEIRQINSVLSEGQGCAGVAIFELGDTKIVARVDGPRHPGRGVIPQHDAGVLTCKVNIAPFAGVERSFLGPGARKTKEIEKVVKQCFQEVVLLDLFPRSEIEVTVQIMSMDGGVLGCVINAVSLALVKAGIPMKDTIVCCTAGFIKGRAVIDLTQSEYSANGMEILVGILPTKNENIALLEMRSKLPLEYAEEVISVAEQGCRTIYESMRETMKQHNFDIVQPLEEDE